MTEQEGANHPNREDDTIAQRPTHIGAGAPAPPSHPEADRAGDNPTAGAQPPEETKPAKLREPHRVAAGMRALTESLRFTMRETGFTRGIGDWLKVNKKDGFDCQSCAWPSPDDHRHVFEFCENGVKALTSEATTKKITPDFFREHSIADLQKQSDHWLELQGRLVHPMVKRAGATHYEAIEWDEAFALLARGAERLADAERGGVLHQRPDEQRGRVSLSAFRAAVRDQQPAGLLEHVPRIERRGAERKSIGVGKGCVTLQDFEKTDCIFILGQNPGTNHPRMMTFLERAKKNGAKIVAINPMPEPGLMEVVNPNPQEYRNPLTFAAKMLFNKGDADWPISGCRSAERRHGRDARDHERDAGGGRTRSPVRSSIANSSSNTRLALKRSSSMSARPRGTTFSKAAA